MNRKVAYAKILMVRGTAPNNPDLLEALQSCFDITIADSLEHALSLIRSSRFDAFLSPCEEILSLEHESVSQQAVAILNTIGEGVCIVAPDGSILWANRKMETFSDAVKQGVSQRSIQAYQYFQENLDAAPQADKDLFKSRKYSYTDNESNRYFEMIATPVLDENGLLVQLATVVWEETGSRRLQLRIDAIDKAGRELVRLEAESLQGLTVEERICLVQDKIIRYAKKLLNFDHFVVRLLNRESNQLEVLFGIGLNGDADTELFAHVENNGITGYVAATARSYICNNPPADPHYLPGLDGSRCSLTVPLLLHDKVIGTLNVESEKEAAFREDDRQMAEIFGRYIAIALNILDLLVVERYETTGQAADSLSEQVSAPLSSILTEASLLMEEYIGHDDIRRRLQSIIDQSAKIKGSLKGLQCMPKGILGARPTDSYATDADLAGKHILVVDDEPVICQTICDIAQKHGCLVDMAHDGRQALALLNQSGYDLVVSDIKLPHANGYEIFATARQADKQIPVILMTGFGYDPNHSIVRANREGLAAVLYKPFKVDQLIGEIRSALTASS